MPHEVPSTSSSPKNLKHRHPRKKVTVSQSYHHNNNNKKTYYGLAPTMAPTDAKALDEILASTSALLAQFLASLSDNSPIPSDKRIADPPNPLQVFADASKLLKAHVTKLSLLVLNKPFTPSAVTRVLRDLSTTCLPALISGVQICQQEKAVWSAFLGREAAVRTRRVFRELETLLGEVKSVAQGAAAGSSGGRDSLSATGVVWESCDALAELNALGLAGLAVQKAEQWRETIRDAIEELLEWAEGEDLETEGKTDELLDSDDEGVEGDDNDSLNDLFNAANSMPADRPELKELVEQAVEKLKKVEIMYKALAKRRLKAYKAVKSQEGVKSSAELLDEITDSLSTLPDMVDDLASTFYDLEEEQAKKALGECVTKARETAELARLDYEGKEDQFSTWSKKWMEAIG